LLLTDWILGGHLVCDLISYEATQVELHIPCSKNSKYPNHISELPLPITLSIYPLRLLHHHNFPTPIPTYGMNIVVNLPKTKKPPPPPLSDLRKKPSDGIPFILEEPDPDPDPDTQAEGNRGFHLLPSASSETVAGTEAGLDTGGEGGILLVSHDCDVGTEEEGWERWGRAVPPDLSTQWYFCRKWVEAIELSRDGILMGLGGNSGWKARWLRFENSGCIHVW
jgi:hypothetical protein